MSPTDQQGSPPLTRKQLRELRLTGATPVITPEQAEAAAEADEAALAEKERNAAAPLPRAADPVEIAPMPSADSAVDMDAAPLTRRQAREQERLRTASVPVIGEQPDGEHADDAAQATDESDAIVSGVPAFAPDQSTASDDDAEADADAELPEADADADAELPEAEAEAEAEADADAEPVDAEPVDAPEDDVAEDDVAEDDAADVSDDDLSDDAQSDESASDDTESDDLASDDVESDDAESDDADEPHLHPVEALLQAGATDADPSVIAASELSDEHDDVDEDTEGALDDDAVSDEAEDEARPTVNEGFGRGVTETDRAAQTPSFDELITTGSHHVAPSAVIFNPPARGSLSGPVAATGEMLVTGSYDLPSGLGSRGFADGVADGSDIDAVLIDGELPATSSPTPIAASSAVSTSKPAGEVIRPPVPEKGNKLMLTLAIVAGGLALVLAAALVVAFSMNVF